VLCDIVSVMSLNEYRYAVKAESRRRDLMMLRVLSACSALLGATSAVVVGGSLLLGAAVCVVAFSILALFSSLLLP
jgi:hypothetical protein